MATNYFNFDDLHICKMAKPRQICLRHFFRLIYRLMSAFMADIFSCYSLGTKANRLRNIHSSLCLFSIYTSNGCFSICYACFYVFMPSKWFLHTHSTFQMGPFLYKQLEQRKINRCQFHVICCCAWLFECVFSIFVQLVLEHLVVFIDFSEVFGVVFFMECETRKPRSNKCGGNVDKIATTATIFSNYFETGM